MSLPVLCSSWYISLYCAAVKLLFNCAVSFAVLCNSQCSSLYCAAFDVSCCIVQQLVSIAVSCSSQWRSGAVSLAILWSIAVLCSSQYYSIMQQSYSCCTAQCLLLCCEATCIAVLCSSQCPLPYCAADIAPCRIVLQKVCFDWHAAVSASYCIVKQSVSLATLCSSQCPLPYCTAVSVF